MASQVRDPTVSGLKDYLLLGLEVGLDDESGDCCQHVLACYIVSCAGSSVGIGAVYRGCLEGYVGGSLQEGTHVFLACSSFLFDVLAHCRPLLEAVKFEGFI